MAAEPTFEPLTGQCTCKSITYSLLAPPLITNCCHCTYCQRETGSAFVVNSVLETSNLHVTSTTHPTIVNTSSASGKGQLIARCPSCYVAVYSHYPGLGKWMTFIRAGTLDEGSRQRVRPDVHIFTSSKVEWLDLSKEVDRGVEVCAEYYVKEEIWGKESLERWTVLKEKIDTAKAG